jgi:hypothetical protein
MSAKAVVSSLILAGAVSIFLLPLATPAVAELGHPSGCFMCSPVDVTAPTQDYYREGAPAIGLELRMGFPPGATALSPETDAAAAPKIRHLRQHHARRAQL